MWPFKKKPVEAPRPVLAVSTFRVEGKLLPSAEDRRWKPYYFIPSSTCYQLEDKGVRLVLYRWGKTTYSLTSNGVDLAGNEIEPYYRAIDDRFAKIKAEREAADRQRAIDAIDIARGAPRE